MKKKISLLLLCLVCLLGITGCETEEERLQKELEKSNQRIRDSVNDYLDTQKTISDYYKYKNAVDNAR